ncbi:Seed maturation protein domain protein [Candidatus Magnetomorum sp. HK-1]|nr:Seed maturation protein domain protein [Candidatus Magnetomorum sp. HK-1]
MGKSKNMTKSDAARIQSSTAKNHGGNTPKNSFASRAQSAADKSSNSKK